MLNKIIGFSIKNKLIVGIFTIVLILYGVFEITKLPIDAVPDITNNQVQVITIAPSYGATDIERLVTFPVEQANSNISGLKEIRSYSRFGLSLVTIVFNDDVDIYWARQQVAERLQQVQAEIPDGIGRPEMGPISTGLGEIYQYVVRPKKGFEHKYSITELRTIQDWIVRRQLLGVKGVAEVSSFGGKLKQYEVAINSNKLQSYGITINDVFKALETNNQNTGGSYIERKAGVLYIRSEGLLTNAEDVGDIAIPKAGGSAPLLIRNVADVRIGHATRYGALTYNDEGEVSGAIVMMLKGGNSNVVIEDIKERIELIQKSLPEGVVIEPFLDRTKMVNNAISTVKTNLMEGALIVVFVLVVFLGNLRAGFLVASVIPLSMLFAVIMMNIFKVSGNLMSLGALDFGLIVDGAVIIVEAVMHQLAHSNKFIGDSKLSTDDMNHEVKSSASKMMNSAVFGQVIILIVYLPIFTLEGIEGKMFKPMAQTVAFALLGAFILSLTYIPMMSTIFLSRKRKEKLNLSDRIMLRIQSTYKNALTRVLVFPKAVITATVSLFVIALIILSQMGGEFIPSIEEGDYAVETRVLAGSNLNTTIESTQKVVHILKTHFPEVEKIVTKIGSSEVPTEPLPMDMGDMIITLKHKSEWTSASSFDELSAKMTAAAQEVPGVTTSFQFPVQMRFNELMTGARQDVVCKIFGENLDTLSFYAKKLGNVVSQVEGATELYVETISGLPQIVIDYNRPALAQYGLSVNEVNQVVNTAFAGQAAGIVFEGEKRFDLVVRLENENRQDLKDVQNLLVPTPNGSQIPLYQVADVNLKDSPNQIQREDAKRRILVGFNVEERDVASIVNELQAKVEKSIKLPPGYIITYGGAFENLNAAKDRLMIAVPVSLALIFLLLYFAFNSIRQGLLIYTAIPLSAIGGIFLLAARGMPFSISAGVGFIALFGIAVLNGIVLVAEFNRLKAKGETDIRQIVIKGTGTRLRPVLMTAAVASLGFLPMALSSGAGGEVQRPLATVVIGGLLIATFLTLFVLPVLYIQFEKGFKVKTKTIKAATIILLLFTSQYSSGQTPIKLEEAIDTALKNNLLIKRGILEAEVRKQIINTSMDLPKTQLSGEYGKFNSPYNDSRFSLVQTLSFPTFYKKQKELYEEEWKSSLLKTNLTEAGIKMQVSQLYYLSRYLQEKEKLLIRTDSMYNEFLRVSKIRFKSGETNILESTSASNQKGAIRLQLNQIKLDKESLNIQFTNVLNSRQVFTPASGPLKFEIATDTSLIAEHPVLQLAAQHELIQQANTKLEKARLLPDLSVGYNNLSIRDGLDFGTSDRFSSVQAGVGIPIFTRAQKAKVEASRLSEVVSRNEYELEKQNLQKKYLQVNSHYLKSLADVQHYEENALRDAKTIRSTLSMQLGKGEINYLEWTLLNQQALTIESDYLDAVNELNQNSIELEYLLSNSK
ncbi:MAG: CusA/CzcA family heavy metal efflux RND transporter [Daejeonella sp.]|uniref:CusA/CzcA family heavy metal efflux RND transporter n=1 Tax=Daejeonella sp. TaxID=2805397 RepID=UPI003C76B6FC